MLEISKDLCVLEAHPEHWIDLGFDQFFGGIPAGLRVIIDLASQGIEVFERED